MIDSTMPPTYTQKRMATLTEAAYHTRRAINYSVIILIGFLILRSILQGLIGVLIYLFPPRAPLPNHKFGVLPSLKFPEIASPSGDIQFRLETIEGTVPKASDSAVVYFMPKLSANFNGLPKAQEFAKNYLFSPAPIQEDKTTFRFADPAYPLRKLRYDIVSHNFIIRYAFEQDAGLFTDNNVPSGDAIVTNTIEMLRQNRLLVDDYTKSDSRVTYLRFTDNKLIPSESQSQADAVRVDIFRKPIKGWSVYTPFPDEGAISIIYSGSQIMQKNMLQFAYSYWPVDYKTFGTYKLKSGQQAWQELQDGKGYIPRWPIQSSNIVVRQMKLGYYDSFEPQNYLQPVFIFEGDDGFIGYVPAVADPWVKK